MKHIISISMAMVFLSIGLNARTSGVRYIEASSLTLVGKMMPTTNPYHRVDTLAYKGFDELESLELRSPAGMAVAFRTDSERISVLSEFGDERAASYTMFLASRGYDLYIREGDEWVWAACNALKPDERDIDCLLISGMEEGAVKECLLYLPMFTELRSCKIGVDDDAFVESIPNPFRSRLVFYGSSFTQGTGSSRSSMSYPLQFGRMTGYGILSMGMGARGVMQDSVAEVLEDVEADAFVFDTFSNPPVQMIRERLFPFIERMQAAHPGVPLIFQQSQIMRQCRFRPGDDRFQRERMTEVAKMMEEAVRRYPDVYFIRPDISGQIYESTVDGVHLDDYGYFLWARSIERPLRKILRKYGI